MAVRLVMGDVDERYLAQMQGFLEKNYPSEAEIHSFTNADSLEDFVKREGADVVLINPRLGIGVKRLYRAGAVAVAYLDEKDGAPDVTGERIVGKYKRPDVFLGIVKEIADEGAARARVNARLEADRARQAAEEEARRAAEEEAARAAAERARREEEETAKQFQAGAETSAGGWDAPSPIPVFGIPSEDDPLDDQKTIAFTSGTDFKGPAAKIIEVTSFSGGTGATTISAALAKNLAARGLKVMYLNLETACSCGSLFQSDDPELMLTLSSDHILELLGGLRYAGMFSHIIVDFNFLVSEQDLRILGSADRILILNDGSVTANAKYLKSFRLVQYLEKLTGISVTDRMELIYNRFSSSKSSTTIPDPGISVIGRIPPIKHATTEEIVEYIKTNMNVLKRIS